MESSLRPVRRQRAGPTVARRGLPARFCLSACRAPRCSFLIRAVIRQTNTDLSLFVLSHTDQSLASRADASAAVARYSPICRSGRAPLCRLWFGRVPLALAPATH
eukprot:6845880-Pyramimonas_sp.AAC.1